MSEQIPYDKIIEMIDLLITIIGDVRLGEARSWAEVRANAEALLGEGHEDQP